MLTERLIRDARPEAKTRILWDHQVKGLGVRITSRGTKSYILNYRVAGREHRATLARASEISLKTARERAGTELLRIRDGGADPLSRRRDARGAPTVNDGLNRFFEEFAPARVVSGWLTEVTVQTYRNQAGNYLRPSLGKRLIADVKRLHVEEMVKPLKPTLRNRVLAFTSRLFTVFETWEWRAQHSNPVRGVERTKETPRDRALDPSELAALSAALGDFEAEHPFEVAAIRTAAMTGLRISEYLALAWEHVSFETGRAVLPKTKTGRRITPLAAPVLELLAQLPRINGNPWVFVGARAGRPVTYQAARALFAEACERAGLTDVRLHDLRRTVATSLAAAGINAYTLRDVLGHKTLAISNRYVQTAGDALTEATERAAEIASAAMAGASKGDEVASVERHRG